MSPIAEPILREPQAVYQAKASEYLTSHQLADFRRCPLLYRKKKLGLIEEGDRPAWGPAGVSGRPHPAHPAA